MAWGTDAKLNTVHEERAGTHSILLFQQFRKENLNMGVFIIENLMIPNVGFACFACPINTAISADITAALRRNRSDPSIDYAVSPKVRPRERGHLSKIMILNVLYLQPSRAAFNMATISFN